MIRIAGYAALILFTLAVLMILWQFNIAIVMFALSLSIAAAMRPMIDSLANRGFPRLAALAGVYLVLIITILLIVFVAGEGVLNDIQDGVDLLLNLYEKTVYNQENGSFPGSFSANLPSTEALYEIITEEQVTLVIGSVFGFAEGAAQAIGQTAIVLVLSIYWSLDRVRFERLWLSLLPVHSRSRAREIWQAVEQGVGAYIRRQFSESIIAGILLWAGFIIMGIEMAALLSVIAAFLLLIPWVGIVLAVIASFLLGLMTNGLWGGVGAAAYTLLILLVVDLVIAPRLFTSNRYSSLLLLILIVALSEAYGIVGAVLAPPLAVSIQVFLGNLIQVNLTPQTTDSELEISNLEERLSDVKESINRSPEPVPPEISSLAERLEQLLSKINQYNQPYS